MATKSKYLTKLKQLEAAERILDNQTISYFVNRLSIQQMNRSIATYRRHLRGDKISEKTRLGLLNRLQAVMKTRTALLGQVHTSQFNRKIFREKWVKLLRELNEQ